MTTPGVLSNAERNELAGSLSELLPYGEAEQQNFLDLIEEAIADYRETRKPAQIDLLARKDRMKHVAKAAGVFAVAMSDLDGDTLDLLVQSIWAVEGKGGDIPADAIARLREAGKLAARAAGGAQHWMDNPGFSKGLVKTKAALYGFIGELGRCYLATFNERPTASTNGPFAKALNFIFDAGGLDVRVKVPGKSFGRAGLVIDRTRLAAIIRTRVLGGPNPKPGRKRIAK